MRTASRTAEHVALFRALETRRRDRLFADDLAIRFLPARYRWLVRSAALPPLGHRIARIIDRRYPGGPRTSAVARTRLIDDLLAAAEPDQALLLGAGYDSRAHRLPGMPLTYEVDHPLTQRAKRQRVALRQPRPPPSRHAAHLRGGPSPDPAGQTAARRRPAARPLRARRPGRRPARHGPRRLPPEAHGCRLGGRHQLPHRRGRR
ncbi:methyltransferase, partial [Amycolatopsis vancoresmycina DSM 44592]